MRLELLEDLSQKNGGLDGSPTRKRAGFEARESSSQLLNALNAQTDLKPLNTIK